MSIPPISSGSSNAGVTYSGARPNFLGTPVFNSPSSTLPAGSSSSGGSWFDRLSSAGSGLLSGLGSAVLGIGQNLWEGFSGIGSGVLNLFQGNIGTGLLSIGKSLFSTVFQTPLDALLMGGGSLLGSIQTAFGFEPIGRSLSEEEQVELQKVYGESVSYNKVRVKEGNVGLFGIPGRPFTLGNTIYVPNDGRPSSGNLLVHEMAHVWQHQNGGTDYLSEALLAQHFGDGYDYLKGIDSGLAWKDLNPEQQAELIQEAHSSGYFSLPEARFVVRGIDYSSYLQNALAEVWSGRGAP